MKKTLALGVLVLVGGCGEREYGFARTSSASLTSFCPADLPIVEDSDGDGEIIGSNEAECLVGSDGADRIDGRGGDDVIVGGAGDDELSGGNGADILYGGEGSDILLGGNGDDVVDGGDGNDTIVGANGADTLLGGSGNDLIESGHAEDSVDGGPGTDACLGPNCEYGEGSSGDCKDDLDCLGGSCFAAVGICVFCQSDASCDDAESCTIDSCLPFHGCLNDALEEGSACEVGGEPGTCIEATCVADPCPEGWYRTYGPGEAPWTGQMAYDSARDRIVFFGTVLEGGSLRSGTWQYTSSGWEELQTQQVPSVRSNHFMAYDASRDRVVVYGGSPPGSASFRQDTWEFDGTDWIQLSTDANPGPRASGAIAYDPVRARTVLHGGHAGTIGSDFGDTWEWDGQSWTSVSTTGPSSRHDHAMIYDASRNRMVLFGGARDANDFHDTWEYDGSSWDQVEVEGSSPSGRHDHAMAYDSTRHVTVLFGGGPNGSQDSQTWEYDGASWAQATVAGDIAALRGMSLVFDVSRGILVLHGGRQDSGPIAHSGTWEARLY